MDIKYIGKYIEITDSIRQYAEKKLAKLERIFDREAEGQVKFTQEKGNRDIVEITITSGSIIFRAEEASSDMYASIDKAVDKLIRQIRRHRTKLERRLHEGALTIEAEAPVEEFAEEEERKVVRTKHFFVKPMSVEDAMLQMEQLGHNFYLFLNADSNRMCVLYQRQDGDYGLLEPEN